MNKRSITLNLACDGGRAIFHRLLSDADVVIDNHPPEVATGDSRESPKETPSRWREAATLGLDYASLKTVNPRLVVTAISPFGHTGPWRD